MTLSGVLKQHFNWANAIINQCWIGCLLANKCLSNAKRPCDCCVLCLRPKSSLCSCPHYILDLTVTFGEYFRWRGTISSNSHCHWSGKTRDIPVLYGDETLTDDYFVLSQYTHLTDGQTELWQQYCALHYMQSHRKNCFRQT